MERRTLIKGGLATISAAHLWIPKIAIAKVTGDPRDAIIKTNGVITSIWGLADQKPAQHVVTQRAEYAPKVKTSWAKLERHSYDIKDGPGTDLCRTPRRRDLALVGAFRPNRRDYCRAFYKRGAVEDIAYVSTLPYIMMGLVLERAARAASSSSTVGYFYPVEYVQIFDALLGSAPTVPAKVIAETGIWVTTYDAQNRNGVFRVTRRTGRNTPIHEENFEYDFG